MPTARRKRGRPPKPAAERASRRLSLYLTDAQYHGVQRLAALSGQTVGELTLGLYADAIEESGADIIIPPRRTATARNAA